MNCLKGDVVLFPYPFSNLTGRKVRPAVIVGKTSSNSSDVFIVPLTSRTNNLAEGEFVLFDTKQAGLNVISAVKRGCFLVDRQLTISKIGKLSSRDLLLLENSLRNWLDLQKA
ncbi:MAG: type II toxin-antitoxin system PemK/MazF family toxin [Planctomycetes bacterium]|nr:type II toxin-antitoxin system PemK/MazF family toxin [Planctomycetota bacterium]